MNDGRRASDELLIQMIREGLYEAEIAVRLGVTTGDVRARKADLRNRLGAERYLSLTGAAAAGSPSRRRGAVAGGAAVGLVAAMVLVAANLFDRGEDNPAISPAQAATATLTGPLLRAPGAVNVESRPFQDLGRVFLPASGGAGGIGEVEHRAAMAVVPMLQTAYLVNSRSVHWTLTSNSLTDAYLRADTVDRQLDVAIHALGDARLRPVAAGVGPALEIEDIDRQPGATVLVRVTQGGAPVEARVTADGRILVAPAPLPAGTVLDTFTGSALDVSRARAFGTIPLTPATRVQNGCEPTEPAGLDEPLRCRVLWLRTNRGLTAPVDGVYSCAGARSLEFRGDGIRLLFFLRGEASTRFACQPSEVRAGDGIVPDGEWVVVAFDAADSPQSIVVAMNGQVYVGEVRGSVTCPCLPS